MISVTVLHVTWVEYRLNSVLANIQQNLNLIFQ